LYGVSARDAWVYVTASLALLLVALAGSWIPARRAARTDPNVALRVD
jgi:ABC-type lipoprotein release transport system permease subunit